MYNNRIMLETSCADRCELLAKYVIETKSTVRSAAQHFGISKSTVHKDLTTRLRYISRSLYEDVRAILEENKQQRHIRGGEATRIKYSRKAKARKSREECPTPFICDNYTT